MKEPIRILQVATTMGRGGVETLLMNLYRAIDRNQVQFDFLLHRPNESDYDQEILDKGGRIYRLPPLKALAFFSYEKQARLFFRSHPEYRIVHSHINTFSMLPLRAAMLEGVPVRIAHAHTGTTTRNIKGLFKYTSGLFLNNYVTHRITCSDKAAQWVFGKQAKNAIFLSNGINTQQFQYNAETRKTVRQKFQWEDRLVLGAVASFLPVKNHSFMLDLMEQLKKESHVNPLLICVGKGKPEEEKYIRNKITRLHLENNVILLGVRSDVYDLLQGFDAYLIPSLYEGLPVSVIEAQTAGLPVFASNSISNDAKITDLCHFISLKKGPEFWAQFIMHKMSSFQRKDFSSQVKEKGFDIVQSAIWLSKFYQNLHDDLASLYKEN